MNPSDKDRLYLTLLLVMLVALDIGLGVAILLHGKANFSELFKHLKP